MTTVSVDEAELVVRVHGLDRLWSFKSELRVPLAHVIDAAPAADEARSWWHGVRAPGTNVPGVITAGTFHSHEGRVFWDVHKPDQAIAITLRDDRFAKLVIEVGDVAATIAMIRTAISASATSST